jgi:hypothetical protein
VVLKMPANGAAKKVPTLKRELLGFRQAFVYGAFEAERCEHVAAAQPMLQLRRLREKVR